MGAEVHSTFKQKIHFLIQKEVPYGKALYVVGEIQQLGSWEVAKSLRLSWNREHYWTGFIELPTNFNLRSIQFRYAICDWSKPSKQNIIWEAGQTNRVVELQPSSQHVICDNSWNMDRITVNLIVSEQFQQHEYFIAGDCSELGNWRKGIKLNPTKARIHSSLVNLMESKDDIKYILYSCTFQLFRGKSKINYCYVRKNKSETEVERLPSRQYSLSTRTSNHTKCLKVLSLNGNISILDKSCFQELNYSVISQNILLGPYLQSSQDFALLKQKGVTAILSLQTQQDFELHMLNLDYLIEKSQKNNIKHYHFQIEDANRKDFLEKFRAPIQLLCQLIKRGEIVYVHCSAGIHRSPQIVAIFLALSQNFSADQAIEYVRSRHPFARPSQEVVSRALNMMSGKATTSC